MKKTHYTVVLFLALSLALQTFGTAVAADELPPLPAPIQTLTQRTDRALQEGRAGAIWVWGPRVQDNIEDYKEAKEGKRSVYYFEKGRLEITDPAKDTADPYYTTSGLLLREMITGKVQLGNDTFIQRESATVPLAGDIPARIPDAPTYASLFNLVSFDGTWKSDDFTNKAVVLTLKGGGQVTAQPDLANLGVTYAQYVKETGHNIAKPFVEFFAKRGDVYANGKYSQQQLFDPLYVFGYPISEPYWTNVTLGGTPTQVLVQAFERRLLTYTPGNADQFKVEFGNLGLAYAQWRYKTPVAEIDPAADPAYNYPAESDGFKLFNASNDNMRALTSVKRVVIQNGKQTATQEFQAPNRAHALEATVYRGQPATLETIVVGSRVFQRLRQGNQSSAWYYEDLAAPYSWPAGFTAFRPVSLNDWTHDFKLADTRKVANDNILPLVADYYEIDGSTVHDVREVSEKNGVLLNVTSETKLPEGIQLSVALNYRDYNVPNKIEAPANAQPLGVSNAGDTGLYNFGEVRYEFGSRGQQNSLGTELLGYQRIHDYQANGILVRFKDGLSNYATSSSFQQTYAGLKIAAGWENSVGDLPVLFRAQASEMRLTLDKLRNDPRVEYAEPNYKRESFITSFNDPQNADQYYLNVIKTARAWDYSTGSKNVTVAVIDSGIDTEHPDLKGNIAETYNSNKNSQDVTDVVGHGSWTGGIIGAIGNNGVFGSGIAWNSRLLVIRGDNDDDGSFSDASVIQAVRYATDKNVRVINLSLGGNQDSKALRDGIAYATKRGVLVVASSGNSGTSQLKYPASYPGVISVGATGLLNQPASFSSYGTNVILSAPGVRICNTVRAGQFACPDGTSASAPIVSAAAALLFAVNPSLSADQVKAILIASASPAPGKGVGQRDEKYGYGIINVAAALQMAATNRLPALPTDIPQ